MIEDFLPARAKRPEPAPVMVTEDIDDFQEPAFRPPEAIEADSFESRQTSNSTNSTLRKQSPDVSASRHDNEVKPPKKSKLPFGLRKPNLSKKQWIIVGCIGLVILVLIGGLTWKLTRKPKPVAMTEPVVEQKQEEPPKPTTFPSRLTGMMVGQADADTAVTAVMIENSPDARPQAGLNEAGIVYEAVAEGGITRFLTLFQESKPEHIGPVRSVRPYYLDWLVPFDAPVAHVGGSPEALGQIRNEGIKDLDYSFNSGAYQRVSNRYAPHNVYTSRANLLGLHSSKGWNSSSFTGWARKDEAASAAPNARAIDFAISGFLYNPHFDYDQANNSYKRSQAGKPHVDEKSGAQISPKVVIGIVVAKGIHPDGVHTTYATHGSGKAYIFQDGIVTVGTWSKADRKSEMKFTDAAGAPIPSIAAIPGSVSLGLKAQ